MTTAVELREALDLHRKNLDKYEQRILDAARNIALPILEGGEKVWFCEAHKAMSASGFPAERQICPVYVVLEGAAKSECRMVERILIPLPQMVAE